MDIKNHNMDIAGQIRKVREFKGLTQKEVAMAIGMDQSQYSRIEKGKTDPSSSTLQKVAKAMGASVADFFNDKDPLKEISSYDSSMLEKMQLIELLDEEEKKSIYKIIDGLVYKRKLKDTLTSALKTD